MLYFDNLQVAHARGRIVEENHYYAYGLRIAGISSRKLPDANEGHIMNRDLYNDKELIDDADLNWYDYGFRNYDPQIGRFPQLDPLTHDYPYYTPFQYAGCEPIANIDIDGLEPGLSTTAATAKTLPTIYITGHRAVSAAATVGVGVVGTALNITNTGLKGFIQGRPGDNLASNWSFSFFKETGQIFLHFANDAQAFNFSEAVGGVFGRKGSTRIVRLDYSSPLYREILSEIKKTYNLTETDLGSGLMEELTTLDFSTDKSELFWAQAPSMILSQIGPGVLPAPSIPAPAIALPPGAVSASDGYTIFINEVSKSVVEKYRIPLTLLAKKKKTEDQKAAEQRARQESVQHEGGSGATADKHTKRRAGEQTGRNRNNKRGKKNKKFTPKINPNNYGN